MAFWWVNHKRSWKAETGRGALWSPLTKSDKTSYRAYSNMALARSGDVVFSFANGKIGHVGVVDAEATFAPKPDYATDAPWANDGWMLPVTFTALASPINPRDHLDVIERYRPESHSPIRANGHGTMNYLSAISDDFGNALLRIASLDVNRLAVSSGENTILEDLDDINKDSVAAATLRLQLSNARIGQGLFRKRVLAMEPACRVTGVTAATLLIASHIKPWRESTNAERLDGANGLMLAPHADLLFDRHLISFTDDGRLIISKRLDIAVLEGWHIANSAISASFHPRQKAYLAVHRAQLA
ncbi:HNH endonuclease [Luteibacter yeojuensis]